MLRVENASLAQKLATLEVSNIMAMNGHPAILPEDEDYDVDGAEARIIYKLHEKLKTTQRRVKRLESEKEDLVVKLQDAQRRDRVATVTKNVCEKMKHKIKELQRELLNAKKSHKAIKSVDVRCY